jgi:hypothetical protein
MTYLEEIIWAAQGGNWTHATWGDKSLEWPYYRQSVGYEEREGILVSVCISPRYATEEENSDNLGFIATFDPHHVALMEACIQSCDLSHPAWGALVAYRRENNLL